MKRTFNIVAAALLVTIGALLAPAPAPAADAVVIPQNLVARVAALEASTNQLFSAALQSVLINATNDIAVLKTGTNAWNAASTASISATNSIAALQAWKAAGITGVVTNDLTATNVLTYSTGLVTNRVTTGQ